MTSSYSQKFKDISNFLKELQNIHDMEFLKHYPSPYPLFIEEWIDELKTWSFDKLALFESSPNPSLIQNESFKKFIETIQELTALNKLTVEETKMPSEFLRKMNPKKKHEIQTLKTICDNDDGIETIIDIGGGAGHLSCALLHSTDKRSLCLDYDSSIQASGKKKIERWLDYLNDRIDFVTLFFDESTELERSFNSSTTSIVGLHSCGNLSTALIKFALKNNIHSIINFGCCYHKLDGSYNLSELSKVNGITFTNNALHLASRSSAKVTSEDIKRRFLVRRYRYTLHYFLNDHFDLPFSGIGNTSRRDYESSFSNYARKYHKGAELHSISDEQLDSYFSSEKVQENVIKNVLADMIRLNFGRVIEVYLLLDRAILLEEAGREVSLKECFDRSLSPRNILLKSLL